MIISRKSPSFLTSLSPLFLNSSQLEQVNPFKYLGIIITSNLLWSPHMQSVCSKVHQTIGTIYCNFYKHASPHTLLTLYCTLVISYFSYCSSVWDPPVSSTNAEILDKTQYFVLKICFHKWDNDYSSLLLAFNLPTISTATLFTNYVFSIKSLTTSSIFLLIFSFTNLWQVMLLVTLILSPLPSSPFLTHLLYKTHLSLLFCLYGIDYLIM